MHCLAAENLRSHKLKTSEKFSAVFAAFIDATGEFESIERNSFNPFTQKYYAGLGDAVDEIRKAFRKHGLSFAQPTRTTYVESSNASGEIQRRQVTVIETIVIHKSGEWISSEPLELTITKANDPQAFGAALTYFRRYQLTAFVGLPQEDDDGEKASKSAKSEQDKQSRPQARTSVTPGAGPVGQQPGTPPVSQTRPVIGVKNTGPRSQAGPPQSQQSFEQFPPF